MILRRLSRTLYESFPFRKNIPCIYPEYLFHNKKTKTKKKLSRIHITYMLDYPYRLNILGNTYSLDYLIYGLVIYLNIYLPCLCARSLF